MKVSVAVTSVFALGMVVFAETDDSTGERLLIERVREVSKMHRVTEKPFKMIPAAAFDCVAPTRASKQTRTPHGDYFCHVFVDEAGRQTMTSGSGEYPVGTVIVKQKFADSRGKATELYTLMRKMEPGYDTEHGDWEYSIVNRKATQVLARGRIESCIECHKSYEQTDYVTRLYIPEPNTPEASATDSDSK